MPCDETMLDALYGYLFATPQRTSNVEHDVHTRETYPEEHGPSSTRREPYVSNFSVLKCKCDNSRIRRDWNGRVGANGLFMEAVKCISGVASLRTPSSSPPPIFDFVKSLCNHFIHKETIGRTITVGHFCSMPDDVKVVYSVSNEQQAEHELFGAIDVFALSRAPKRFVVYLSPYDKNGKLRTVAGLAGTFMHEYWHCLRLPSEEVAAWSQGTLSDTENHPRITFREEAAANWIGEGVSALVEKLSSPPSNQFEWKQLYLDVKRRVVLSMKKYGDCEDLLEQNLEFTEFVSQKLTVDEATKAME